MEVQLYVYDLTRGMARAMSHQLLGIHLDAVYHTSLVFNNVEYFFGQGIQTCFPGATHHGQPMRIESMGTTHLPMETILEYIDSLKQSVYTAESYDLFEHNCNNFTNDLCQFLVSKAIPKDITSLPRRVLDTPFGQMLRPQIDASMRDITQAPVPPGNVPNADSNRPTPAAQTNGSLSTNGQSLRSAPTGAAYGSVVNVTGLGVLEKYLAGASKTAATIFFTSSTCAPCKLAYPTFDSLAEQFPQALFVKVDINDAHDVAKKYNIRATPTFKSFAKGSLHKEWQGADPGLLRSTVEQLVREVYPPHPHTLLKVPTLQFGSLRPVTYPKVPPLDKLMAKLGDSAKNDEIVALNSFISKRTANPKNAPLPDLRKIGRTIQTLVLDLPAEVRFAVVDLLRCALIDPRVSGLFAEEQGPQTLPALIKNVTERQDCFHNQRLVTLHVASNLFTSTLYVKELVRSANDTMSLLIQLISSSLLDASHPTTRVASAYLAFNVAVANYLVRREEERESIDEDLQVELAASVVEALSQEDNPDAAKGLLLALGYLIYCAPVDGEVLDLCKALDAKSTVSGVKAHEVLAKEVASLL